MYNRFLVNEDVIQRVCLDQVREVIQQTVGLRDVVCDPSIHIDQLKRTLTARLMMTLTKGRTETKTEYTAVIGPANCWQAFKKECFPRWLRRYFPVRNNVVMVITATINNHRYCPHIKTPTYGHTVCFDYLLRKEPRECCSPYPTS